MRCPECNEDMTSVGFRGVKINECPSCHGRWFDREGLRQVKDMTDEDLRWLDFDPFGKEADPQPEDAVRPRCPVCKEHMDALRYAESNVEIQRCLHCHGVWLHQGEFEKIIAYLKQVVTSKTAAEYVQDSFKQLMEVATGKEDVADELKDFLVVVKLSEVRAGVEHPKVAEAIKTIYEYLPFL